VVKILAFEVLHHKIRLAGFGLAEIDDVTVGGTSAVFLADASRRINVGNVKAK
jgi:hypothetical protein